MNRALRRVVAVLAAFTLLPIPQAGASAWVNSVSFSSPSNGAVAGFVDTAVVSEKAGFVSLTDDGGQTFRAVPLDGFAAGMVTGNPNRILVAPTGFSDDAYFGTRAGLGSTWSWLYSPEVLGQTARPQYSGSAMLADRAVVVGYQTGTASGQLARIVGSSNDGATWTEDFKGPYYPPPSDDSTPPLPYSSLVSVDAAPGGMVAWAVGTEGKSVGGLPSYIGPLIVKTSNGGGSWAAQPVGVSGLLYGMNAVAAVSTDTVFAIDTLRTLIRSTNGGASWSKVTLPVDPESRDPYIFALAMDARAPGKVVVVGANGKIAWTSNATDATPTWSFFNAGMAARLRSVAMLTDDKWMVVGDDELILRTSDAGATWTTQGSAPPVGAITGPEDGFDTSAPVTISGTATDTGLGVKRVDLRMQRADGLYWNGFAFAAGETWVPAVVDQYSSAWSYDWANPALSLGKIVTVSVRVTDAAGSTNAPLYPTVNSGVTAGGEISLAGGASYINTTTIPVSLAWSSATHMRKSVDGSTSTGWVSVASTDTVVVPAGDGLKTVSYGFSHDGSSWDSTATDDIVLDTTAPSLTLSAPAAGFVYRAPNVPISGTVDDSSSGVESVDLSIEQGGLYWTGNTWSTSTRWIPAAVDEGSWNYPLFPSDETSVSGKPVTVTVRARDYAGNTTQESRRSQDPLDKTAIVLSSVSSFLSYGGTGYIKGTLSVDGIPASGTLELWEKPYNASSSKKVSSTNASSLGAFAFARKPTVKTTYQVRFAATASRLAASSGFVTHTPRVYLSTPSAPTSIRARYSFSTAGYIKPRHTSGTRPVRIYKYKKASNGTWTSYGYVTIAVKNYYSYSRYAGSMSLPSRGSWRIRAYHADTAHAATWSSYRYITVK